MKKFDNLDVTREDGSTSAFSDCDASLSHAETGTNGS